MGHKRPQSNGWGLFVGTEDTEVGTEDTEVGTENTEVYYSTHSLHSLYSVVILYNRCQVAITIIGECSREAMDAYGCASRVFSR